MTHHAVIWMDHNEARAVALGDEPGMDRELAHVRAHDRHTHPKKNAGDRHPPDARFVAEVKDVITGCDAVVLFGPSQARHDLVADLETEKSPLCARIVAVLPLDRVTDAQLAARGREVLRDFERMRGVHVSNHGAHVPGTRTP